MRDYTSIHTIARHIGASGEPRELRMRAFVDAVWGEFGREEPEAGDRSISWLGFYVAAPGSMVGEDGARTDGMVLGPSCTKPACSPIGLHGACGQSMVRRATLVVTDVAALGEGYVACDPRDLAELVIPLIAADGSCDGVLDADSFDTGAFGERDAAEVALALEAARLTHNAHSIPVEVH